MDDFAKVLISLRNSQIHLNIIEHPKERLPVSMLFGCCSRASPLGIGDTGTAVEWATDFLANLLKHFNRSEHFITEAIRHIVQTRDVPMHEIPIYETVLCACATPLYALSHSTEPDVRADTTIHDKTHALLKGLDKFLTMCFKDIAYLTQKISYLSDDSHMLMTLFAITAISSSFVMLARLGYVAGHKECASRSIATSLRQICATNVNGKLQAAEDSLLEFDDIWDDKWVFGFPS